ncbi:MAG: hypothetical protein IKG22_08585, partial [Atopobiaceae bacterium]|nr:hypothetical protein [Atopobiaceae bacterium]
PPWGRRKKMFSPIGDETFGISDQTRYSATRQRFPIFCAPGIHKGVTLLRYSRVDSNMSVQRYVHTGLAKESQRIVAVDRYAGSLTTTIDHMLEFVWRRMNRGASASEEAVVARSAEPALLLLLRCRVLCGIHAQNTYDFCG